MAEENVPSSENKEAGADEQQPRQTPHETAKEEHAIVLDYLQYGYPFEEQQVPRTPLIQAIGKHNFTLLELVPKKDIVLQPHDEVYIGDGKRDKIHHIKGRLPFDKLTATARTEIEPVIRELVGSNEQRFVQFFNRAQPLTTRMHQLELLPGLGKKHMWGILDARKEKQFESFDDIRKRVRLMPEPRGIVVRRILAELTGNEKHRVFVM